MQQTGMLNLNIARLEHHLRVLQQQQIMSKNYPEHRANLAQKTLYLQHQLDQLYSKLREM